jgi:hypothetical protein
MHGFVESYATAFAHGDHFVNLFAYSFAQSLPYLSAFEAANLALTHETKPLVECLRSIWNDYKNTDAYKQAVKL